MKNNLNKQLMKCKFTICDNVSTAGSVYCVEHKNILQTVYKEVEKKKPEYPVDKFYGLGLFEYPLKKVYDLAIENYLKVIKQIMEVEG